MGPGQCPGRPGAGKPLGAYADVAAACGPFPQHAGRINFPQPLGEVESNFFGMFARHTGHFCIGGIRPQSAQQHTCAHGANAMVALACMHTTHALPGSPPPVPAAMLPSALLTELTLVWLADASTSSVTLKLTAFARVSMRREAGWGEARMMVACYVEMMSECHCRPGH